MKQASHKQTTLPQQQTDQQKGGTNQEHDRMKRQITRMKAVARAKAQQPTAKPTTAQSTNTHSNGMILHGNTYTKSNPRSSEDHPKQNSKRKKRIIKPQSRQPK
jgi:hypothetical protein